MRQFFLRIDRILRGEFTAPERLLRGELAIKARELLLSGLVLGAVYGLFMGLHAVMRKDPTALHLVSSPLKVPLLFLLTLFVTFPSLYVFSALAGSRLSFLETLRLLLVGIVINLTLLASFGPVVGFFTVSTESYPFMIVLNVVFFAVSGLAGLVVMYRALDTIVEEASFRQAGSGKKRKRASRGRDKGEEAAPDPTPARADGDVSRTRFIFFTWAVIYGTVGSQMGWILRPFIGSPDLDFEIFRSRESHFFEALFRSIGRLFG